jgi:hypothetical protein
MTPRLRDEDRLAVDLLLDQAVTEAGNGLGNGHVPTGFTQVNGAVQERLAAVEKVLHVLDLLPAEEPPADLMGRTMRRLEAESARDPAALRPPAVETGMQMPHA